MKQTYSLIVMFFMTAIAFAQQPIITAIVDGSCTGGNPKAIEIYAEGTVDFSLFSIERFNNSSSSLEWQRTTNLGSLLLENDEVTVTTITDDFIYIVDSSAGELVFQDEFPSIASDRIFVSNVAGNNGDDSIRIIEDSSSNIIDQFGTEVDGSGEPWEYLDSYAKRIDGSGPDGGFTLSNWTFEPINTLDGQGVCNDANNNPLETIVSTGSYSSQATTNPTLNVNGSPITGLDYFENNGPSEEGTFTVSGMNLTDGVTITASTFEVSLTTGGGFQSSVNIAFPTNGSFPTTTIYVRLPAGLTAADYAESITVESQGATTENVAVAGTVTADDPQITISGNVDDLQYSAGNGPSDEDAFTVSGLFLDPAGISVAVAAPFEVSLTSGGTFTQSVNIPADANNEVDFVDVFVRLAAGQTLGSYSGTITASSAGATDETLDITGTVLAAATCAPVGSIIITEIMQNPNAVNDSAGEYFELYNTTATDIDIQSWIIRDDATPEEAHTIGTSVVIPAGGYIVLVVSGTDNGGITPDYVYDTVSLGNSTDGLVIECNGNSIDTVIWDNGTTFPDPTGASMELSTTALDADLNDDGTNWAEATTAYGAGDLGTPGAVNAFTLSIDGTQKIEFSLYPNPATSGTLNINASNGNSFDIEIFSTLGQRVITQKSVTRSINIDSLTTGMYIVKISQGDASQTRKLVVK